VAAKEDPSPQKSNRRLVLITGEGSLQLTIQALSLLNRFGIPPVIFVLNNRGYTIERFFRGWKAGYNDVDSWDYPALSKAFAPDVSPQVKGFRVQTGEELDTLLSDAEFNAATYPQIVEMVMGVDDAPSWMKAVFEVKEDKKKEEVRETQAADAATAAAGEAQ
jgi:pyruvate decarboxylase